MDKATAGPERAGSGKPAKKVMVVMPAYNAARTLLDTFRRLPAGVYDEIILVDDASSDDTALQSERLGIITIRHSHNVGYGGNQKTCYTEALRRGADVVVMIHPDGQYDPAFLAEIVGPILSGRADVVLGSRMLRSAEALAGGMPYYKFVGNRALTLVENLILGKRLSEYHTGYRAYSRRFLETVPFMRNSNGFVFDTEILFQAAHFNLPIAEIPVTTRYFEAASSVGFRTSCIYGIQTLWVAFRYLCHRLGVVRCRLWTP